ncbi:MAG: hypothetical protein EBR86_11560 [Planctomycetia bacterium]|nr:hypothetical protein [Planctomycetia bacterium]
MVALRGGFAGSVGADLRGPPVRAAIGTVKPLPAGSAVAASATVIRAGPAIRDGATLTIPPLMPAVRIVGAMEQPPGNHRRPRFMFHTLLVAVLAGITATAGEPVPGQPAAPFGLPAVAERLPEPLPESALPAVEALPLPPIEALPVDAMPLATAAADAIEGTDADGRALRFGGLVQFDSTAYAASAGPLQPVDQAGLAPPLSDAVNFRRARLRLDGRMGEQFDWAAEYDLVNQINAFNQIDPLRPSAGPLPEVTDLWLQARDLPFIGRLRVGNQKDPFGFEHLASCRSLDFMERSFCQDAFVGPFNDGFVPGIQALGGTADGLVAWQVGEFVNTAAPFGFADFAGGSMTVGRLVWLPAYADGGRRLLHLGLAGRSMQPRNGLVRFRSRGALWNGPPGPDNAIYADSGVLAGDWQNMLAAEVVANAGPWSLQAEYFGSWLLDAATTDIGPLSTAGWQPPPGTPVGTVFYQGGYVEATTFLTGESRGYSLAEHRFDRPVPFSNFVRSRDRRRGSGAWQAVARYNHLCLDDGQVDGGVLNGVTVGLNWLLTPRARVVFNYDFTYRAYRSTPWANGPAGPVPVPSYDGSGGIHGFGTRVAFDF